MPRDEAGNNYAADGSYLTSVGLGHLVRPADTVAYEAPKAFDQLSPWLKRRITAQTAGKLTRQIARELR